MTKPAATERDGHVAFHLFGKDTSPLAKRPDVCREQYTQGVFPTEPTYTTAKAYVQTIFGEQN